MNEILARLNDAGNLRKLYDIEVSQKYLVYQNKRYLNFSSNDYLGLSDANLQKQFLSALDTEHLFLMSNPSSRLMTGNTHYYKELEDSLAAFYRKEAALVLGCGFLLNTGILPALTDERDLVVADKLVHASLIDGLRLCNCRWTRFRHNDMEHLESVLKKNRKDYRHVYIVTESVFSMDGDIAPLRKMVELKRQYDCSLYVDEAHAFGVRGEQGRGVAEEQGIIADIDILVATMGKALASQGAFVVCSDELKQILVNRMRTLIFSTALPPISLLWSKFLLEKLPAMADKRKHLADLSEWMRSRIPGNVSASHIIPVIVGDNFETLHLSEELIHKGYWITAVRYPTVPEGTARLRVSLSAAMSRDDVEGFVKELKNIWK
ncbi:MAG TPA: 8-amino-7-oxononanoate synthase [Candidatus Avirikenella pullistercoris]|nr:8-amino-7-oxononanoate synthase [Candidatus Avirikenella pullistercoris]